MNQLEGDIKGEKKLKIVIGVPSQRLWRGRSGCGRCRVVALLASCVRMVFIFPEYDTSTIHISGVSLFHDGSAFLPGSAPPPWVKHRDSMNGSSRDSLNSAWDNGNGNEKEVGES